MQTDSKASMGSRARAARFWGVAVLIGVLGGCTSSAGEQADETPPRVVDSTRVMPANGSTEVTLSGRITAAEQTSLSFEISGEIESLAVDVGDSFAAGDTLAVLDDARYQLEYQRSVAAEREAKATQDEAKLAYDRQNSLREKGYTSQSQLDSARASLDAARSRYESAMASRRLAERDLRLTALKAPFTGSVSQRRVEPSERVSPNQTILDVISDRDGFEVDTSVPETLIGRLHDGEPQQVHIPALGDERIPARIKHIGTQPQSSNNYPVVLTLPQPLDGLRSGMTAQVHLKLANGEAEDATLVRIPLTALVYDGDEQAHVLRIGADCTLERVDVAIAHVDERIASVTGALQAGQRIVARGAEFVSPGETVDLMGQGPERYN
ncbi:efflux RND transporter periplasmic adaptor subunit [Marinobacter sp. JSM 1782161]|uniref:efflux RND transporter periplasmic adaptor subunit n=1 Tax=Marinobacter sp. JSM 1782161 TaxID=2685906 RepID=UPI001D18AEA7|nr:efflux RND transporter periplasmic adaptor subunit [Marinobacter sp. JSM 1782161]